MKRSKFKAFNEPGKSFKVVLIPYNENASYFNFLSEQHKRGYRQIIVNSEMMIELIKILLLEYSLSVANIEFMEDNIELNDQISYLLKGANDGKKEALKALLAQLSLIAEESSIDIKLIEVKGYLNNDIKRPLFFRVQSNGGFSINDNGYEFVRDVVIKKIEDYFLQ